MTTRRMLDRSVARGLGTILGTLVLSAILYFNPHLIIAVIIMGIAAMVTETFVGSKLCVRSYIYHDPSYIIKWFSIR